MAFQRRYDFTLVVDYTAYIRRRQTALLPLR